MPFGGRAYGREPSRHAHDAENIERDKCRAEANKPQPKGPFTKPLVEGEAKDLREPIREAGKKTKEHTADDHVVEVSDEKEAVMKLKIHTRHRHKNAAHSTQHEGRDESQEPQHRRRKYDAAAEHRKEPIEYLDASGDSDRHCGDAEKSIYIRPRAHREEVMQPHEE